MLLPLTVSCFSKIQIGFTILVLAHPGSPGKRAVKRVSLLHTHTHVPVLCLSYTHTYWYSVGQSVNDVQQWRMLRASIVFTVTCTVQHSQSNL